MNELKSKLMSYVDDINITNLNELISLMNSPNMRKDINSLLDLIRSNTSSIDSHDIMYIEYLCRAANIIYTYSDGLDTGLSDYEYDELKERYKEETGNEIPISEAIITNNENVIIEAKYTQLRGTLNKIYKLTDEDKLKNKSQKTIDDWVKSIENIYKAKTNSSYNFYDEEVLVTPKFDGISVVGEFDKNGNLLRAVTRGDLSTGEVQDITNVIKHVIPKGPFDNVPHEYGVKYEAMMYDNSLHKYNIEFPRKDGKEYKNTRSAAASIINSLEENPDRIKYLVLIPLKYAYIKNNLDEYSYFENADDIQFEPDELLFYPHLKCRLKDTNEIRKFSFEHKTIDPGLRCDGSVITILDPKLQLTLGRQNNRNLYEVAFKFTEEYGYTKLKDIRWQVGGFGRITPVAIFKEIKLKGNTVEKAAISYQRFKELKLAKGDIVKISYDIIPYMMFDNNDNNCKRGDDYYEGKLFEAPKLCPECSTMLEESEFDGFLQCINPSCPCRKRGKILNFIQKVGIEGISDETVNDFYEYGYLKSIKDIYKLKDKKKSLCKLPGYGEVKVNNILKSIDDHLVVKIDILLGSIGIEGISVKRFNNILQYMSFKDLLDYAYNNDYDEFLSIPGVQEKTAKRLVKGINDNKELIEYLRDIITIIDIDNSSDVLFNAVFTNIRSKELEEFIKDHHGNTQDNVTIGNNITSCICMGTNYTSSFSVKLTEGTSVTLSCTPRSTTYSSYTYSPSTASTNPSQGDTRSRYSYSYTRVWEGDYISTSNTNNFTMPGRDVSINVYANQSSGTLRTETYKCTDDGSYAISYEKFFNYVGKYGSNYELIVGYKPELRYAYGIYEGNPKIRNFTFNDLRDAIGTSNIILRWDFSDYYVNSYNLTFGQGYNYKSIYRTTWMYYPQNWYTSSVDLKANYYTKNIFPIPYSFQYNNTPDSDWYIGGNFYMSDAKDIINTYSKPSNATVDAFKFPRKCWINCPTNFSIFEKTTNDYSQHYIYINYGAIDSDNANTLYNALSGTAYSSTFPNLDSFMGYNPTNGNQSISPFLGSQSFEVNLSNGALGTALDKIDTASDSYMSIYTAFPAYRFRMLIYPAKANTSSITSNATCFLTNTRSTSSGTIFYASIGSLNSGNLPDLNTLPTTAYDLEVPSGVNDVYLTTSLPSSVSQVTSGVPARNFVEGSSYKVSNYKYICTTEASGIVNYKCTFTPSYVPDVDESTKTYRWM